jgi:putative FmdB family regulatory protein
VVKVKCLDNLALVPYGSLAHGILFGAARRVNDVPIYEYECESCHNRLELMQKFSDKPLKKCVKCGGPLHKVLSAPALVFKGTGWYVTDYANPERKKAQKADTDNGGNGDKKAETTSTKTASTSTKSTD